MEGLSKVQQLAVLALPVLFAITVHEAAHGWVAGKLGDPTARRLGRVTLNPIRHIDPVGTVILPALMFFFSGFLFGWAKPVPVDWRNLHNPRRDMALVALAGPGANLLMALCWALVMRFVVSLGEGAAWLALPLLYMGSAGVLINAILMVLNLLPILPLDGGRIVASLLPQRMASSYLRLEPWGLIIVVALLVSGWLWSILQPSIQIIQALGFWVAGVG